MKKIECIIMDWAGTAVDYGCFAPVAAFISAFAEKGLTIDVVQTRKPMGLPKIQHIRELLTMPEVNEQFVSRYGRAWTEEDVVELNSLFEKYLFASLKEYTDPIPGVISTLEQLRADGLKIGSTTGYTREMMDVVLPAAASKGYHVDYCATPNLLPAGRPAPYMIFENLTKLAVPCLDTVVKVGDTIADIKEGVNAKVWSVGIVLGSNEMGLTEAEVKAMPVVELENRINEVKERMLAAGASYVIRNIAELPALIETINSKLNK
ncbi:phosphonoacetaldehyde hydrolase [Bacteroides sp.]